MDPTKVGLRSQKASAGSVTTHFASSNRVKMYQRLVRESPLRHVFFGGNFVLLYKKQQKCGSSAGKVFLPSLLSKLLCGIVDATTYEVCTRHFVRRQVEEKGELGRANHATSLLQELEGNI